MKYLFTLLLSLIFSSSQSQTSQQRLKITVGENIVYARLVDNHTTKAFLQLLPLTLDMEDMYGREKYSGLDHALPKEGIVSKTYAIGDISYWLGGGIAVYYQHDDRLINAGLIEIAKVENGIQHFHVPGTLKVTFELIK